MTSLTSARSKAKVAAFKAEVSSLVPGLVAACDSASIVVGDFGSPTSYSATTAFGTSGANVTQSCGPSGSGTFSLSVTATNGAETQCAPAVVNQNGATFTANSWQTC